MSTNERIGLADAEELLAFHVGSEEVKSPGGEKVVWINAEDFKRILEGVRGGLKESAAAPELLHALKGLLDECAKNGCFGDVSFDHPIVKPAFDAARAAVTKAEGG